MPGPPPSRPSAPPARAPLVGALRMGALRMGAPRPGALPPTGTFLLKRDMNHTVKINTL